ncbi:MAG: hypothetical protein JOZ92_00350 [Candidatus Dormibacteraeota bacterium]|nr:hypothetical protein [Candidatus Dormibacteraeota bacterium]
MNGVAFYVLAAIIVAGAAATVLVPRSLQAGAALAATIVVVGLLCIVAGGVAVGIAEILIPAAAGAALWVAVRGRGYERLLGADAPAPAWWFAAGGAAALSAVAIVVVIASGGAWQSGTGSTSLLTAVHDWAPYALVIAAAGAVAAVAASVVLGRTSADEREVDRAAAEHREREEMARRRREDREAARRRRTPAGEGTR